MSACLNACGSSPAASEAVKIAVRDATMVTSLPSHYFRLTLSLSLSPNVPHAQYRKRFRASYNDEEIKSQIFYWNCYMYCCERQGRKFQALRETKNTWIFFVIEPIAAPSTCSFLPGAVNLAKPSKVKYLFLLSEAAMSRKSHCSNDTQFQPAC